MIELTQGHVPPALAEAVDHRVFAARTPQLPSSNPIRAELTTLFAEKLGLEVPSPESDLVENGLLDSLTLVDLLMHLEQRYDTRISLEDLELDNFRSIARIAQYLSNRIEMRT